MRDANDRGSADETAIIIYTTAALHSVLDQVASQLDSLAKKWKSLEMIFTQTKLEQRMMPKY